MIVILGVIMTVIEVDTVTHVVDRCLSVIVIIDTAPDFHAQKESSNQ